MKRRLISLLVVLMILVGISSPVFAAEEGSTFEGGTLFLVAAPAHAFLIFTNHSPMVLYFGDYSVESGETVTIGAFDGTNGDVGINYELNKLRINSSAYSGAYSIYMEIEFSNLLSIESDITDAIESYGTYDLSDNNCVKFAVELWNDISPSSTDITFNTTLTFADKNNPTENEYYSYFSKFKSTISTNSTYSIHTNFPTWQSCSSIWYYN